MKLIIDIPDNEYKYTCERTLHDRSIWDDAIRKGTPLDDIKAEIEHMACRQYEHRLTLDRQEVIEILDNIGKAESEDKE